MRAELEIQKPTEQGVAIWAAGGVGDRAVLKIESSLAMGAFGQWQCCGLLDKSPSACLTRENRLMEARKAFKGSGHREIKGREFRIFVRNLGGPGEQLMKDARFTFELMPYWWQDVQDFAREMGDYITGIGGAHLGWVNLSTGGHSIPLLAATAGLSRRIHRPPMQIAEITKPTSSEKAATEIFKKEMSYLARRNYLGFDGLVIIDNACADSFRSLRELDVLAAIATTAPLASKPPLSKLHYLEVWNLLAKRGKLIGLWAKKIPVVPVGLTRHLFFGLEFGTRWEKDKHAIIDSCLSGLQGLLEDPDTSLSGLPARESGENIFAVVGDISESTFTTIEKEWRSLGGLCLYAPAPRLKDIYLVRLGNLDESVLFEDLGLNWTYVGDDSSHESTPQFDFDTIVTRLARRAEVLEDEFHDMWRRKDGNNA